MMSGYVWINCTSQEHLKKDKANLRLWLLEIQRSMYPEHALERAKKILPFLLKAKTYDDLQKRKSVASYCLNSSAETLKSDVEAAYAWVTAAASSTARKSK